MPKVDNTGRIWISTHELQDLMYGSRVPESEQWRRYYGKSVNTKVSQGEVFLVGTKIPKSSDPLRTCSKRERFRRVAA